MRRILTAAEMREADRLTIERRGIPGLVLMESAAARVVEVLVREYAPLDRQRLLILCGKGNNGGDGLAVARQLLVRRLSRPLAVLFARPEELSGDAAANLGMLRGAGGEVRIAADFAAWRALRDDALPATLIVDALLGTGLAGPPRGLAAEIVADVNAHWGHARIVAVDMPSGLPSDTAEAEGQAMRADRTVTFTAPKLSQVLYPNASRVGRLSVEPIGTADEVLAGLPGAPLWLTEPGDFRGLFAPRDPRGHKGTYGHAAVVGGSRSKPGAAAMAGTAALRAGAGLATVFTAAGACSAVVARTPELMTEPGAELDDGSLAPFDLARLDGYDAVAIGPGLGTRPDNLALARAVIEHVRAPLVVDADALRALDGLPPFDGRTVVVTPHPGEMARLTGLSTAAVQADRLGVAREYAARSGTVAVLKGARTVVACPDGRAFLNPSGTPGMATGGSGDVLTGLIAGLLAQFPAMPPEHVVAGAVWLHGRAGELAAEAWGEQAMLATDILSGLPAAMRETQ